MLSNCSVRWCCAGKLGSFGITGDFQSGTQIFVRCTEDSSQVWTQQPRTRKMKTMSAPCSAHLSLLHSFLQIMDSNLSTVTFQGWDEDQSSWAAFIRVDICTFGLSSRGSDAAHRAGESARFAVGRTYKSFRHVTWFNSCKPKRSNYHTEMKWTFLHGCMLVWDWGTRAFRVKHIICYSGSVLTHWRVQSTSSLVEWSWQRSWMQDSFAFNHWWLPAVSHFTLKAPYLRNIAKIVTQPFI